MPSSKLAVLLCVLSSFGVPLFAQQGVGSCLPVLQAKDYYSYSQKSNLQEDYLRSIDAETWHVIQTSNDFDFSGLFSGGIFSISDDYKTFDQKRTKYLESLHYTRSQQEALDILSITTSNRAFEAYEACLRTIGTGQPLRVWVSSEDLNSIHLRIKYLKTEVSQPESIGLVGTLIGGSVTGAPMGYLWKGIRKWKNAAEQLIDITRARGVATTKVIIQPSNGSTPEELSLSRADGVLSVKVVGTTDVLRTKDRRGPTVLTPNNGNNTGHCPNEQGHVDEKWCTSQTQSSMATQAPRFFQNARGECSGEGCPWTAWVGPSGAISADSMTATATLNNWGLAVYVTIVADEYEKFGSTQCLDQGPIPVLLNQAVNFGVDKNCLAITNLQWKFLLPGGTEGTMKFGDAASNGGVVVRSGTLIDSGSYVIGSYKIAKEKEAIALQ